jgi:hypothetical protein
LAVAFVAACGGSDPATQDSDSETDSGDSASSSSGADAATGPTASSDTADTAGSASTTGTTSTTGGTDTADTMEPDLPGDTDPPTGLVRFVALGDAGEGNESQYAVADIVEQVCSDRGCDFAVYLGDNFYDTGVESVEDPQFQDKFELPYADLDLPFYVTLGNHDYGTLSNEWVKGTYQVAYTELSDKWTLPSEYYTFETDHVNFIVLDTPRVFWSHEMEAQTAFVQQALAEAGTSKFTVVIGHHPYISNGPHGNAGNYEGAPLPIVGGGSIKDFFESEICGNASVYFSGHDHSLQWHAAPDGCNTNFIVSGAAAKTTEIVDRDNNPAPLYQDATMPGFAWVEIEDATMTVAFYDETGAKNFEDSTTLELAP